MTTYNTMNPVPSSDARDRYDNSENLDNFSNGPLDAYPDRFGVSRQSLQGIRNASQYVDLGPYAAGLVFTSYNQTFSYLGEFYAPSADLTLPYTTTGSGAGEIATFRSVGDAILRSDLANSSSAVKGAGLIGYMPSTTGAVGRTVSARIEDSVSVKDFGATGDGVTDDTLSLQAALNSGIKSLYIPTGKYIVTSQLTSSNAVSLLGNGPSNSKLCFVNCNGFVLTPTDRRYTVQFIGVGILAASLGLYLAVSVNGNNLTRRTPTAQFINCAFNGADQYETNAIWPGETVNAIQEWKAGIKLIDAWGSLIENCTFVGKGQAIASGFDTGTTAIVVEQAMHLTIKRCFVSLIKYGVTVGARSEGFQLLGSQFVGLYTGLTNLVGIGTNTYPNNYIVDDCHFDSTWRGIEFGVGSDSSQVGLCSFTNTLFLRRGNLSGYSAISAIMNRSVVSTNVIQTNGTTLDYISQGDTGIYIGGNENIVSANIGRNCGTFVSLGASSARNNITGNTLIRAGTATSKLFVDAGTDNVLGSNVDTTSGNIGKLVNNSSSRCTRGLGLTYVNEFKTGTGTSTYDSRVECGGGDNSDGNGSYLIRAGSLSTTAAVTNINTVRPNADGASTIGTAALRFSTVYATTGTINTSDERAKQQIKPIDKAALKAWGKVEFLQYKFNDAAEEKSSDARWHFGVVAQRVQEAFAAEGIDAFDYGLLCYDEWEEEQEVLDDDGTVITPYREAGNRFGVRYEEALVLECAYLRSRLA